ncbi:hypothetical protein [Novosphingobium sp. YAF33]|uniref:hypothetical protein n=1 Tax=Novosphingobium sp. YAF33 TaxID=3233082 RepID=UPI003F9B059B
MDDARPSLSAFRRIRIDFAKLKEESRPVTINFARRPVGAPGMRAVDEAEVKALAQTLEMWAALGGSVKEWSTAEATMLQAAAVMRRQAAQIEALRAQVRESRSAACQPCT